MGAKPRVYNSSIKEFKEKLLKNVLFEELETNYPSVVGHTVQPAESRSWRESLPRLEHILHLATLQDDVWISIEERVPYYAKRIDVALFGHNHAGQGAVVLVELKAWSDASRYDEDSFETVIGGRPVKVLHPSLQVKQYQEHLQDFCIAFQTDQALQLHSCAYCPNYAEKGSDSLFDPHFGSLLESNPTFGQNEAEGFASFLKHQLASGDGLTVIMKYDKEGIGPSRLLIQHAKEMIGGQHVFRLLDEQLIANKSILSAVTSAANRGEKAVILVRGGPGTGKSVIALNAIGEALNSKFSVFLVSGSSAFTNGVRRVLGKRLSALVRFTDFFWNHSKNSIDVLIVDEAHRLRSKSEPKVPRGERPKIQQAEELITAGKVVVFFMDENQIISPNEVGEPELIRGIAMEKGITFREFELRSQFRCNGSDAYLRWLDNLLELDGGQDILKLFVPGGFPFQIVDSPKELVDEVRSKNRAIVDSARVVAGWCWPWSDPLPDGLVDDIVIGDFKFPWESKNGKRPPRGVPEAKYWAVDPAGMNQAGTVYSVQGFEMSHVGVIIGPDLLVRNGRWVAVPRRNFSRKLSNKEPEVALPYIKRIYRTLLSRPMDSCSIFCTDPETRQFIESRLTVA